MAIDWPGGIVGPRKNGLFIRPARSGEGRELVVGRWGLIPWFADTADIRYSTNNARAEEVARKPSFKQAWQRGQRCIIPADWFDEPNWESGRNVWWRFHRVDGAPWGLAGLWGSWTDRSTGEVIESYTLLTINADHHPVMRRMHKPDPALPADAQDKRSVVAIEAADVDRWLHSPVEEARGLLQPPAESLLRHGPSEAAPLPGLPGF
ncbi:MAG: SOS response-associated peptidase family protein [Hydrogenophaga sp.]|nr:DUF159 family protein [Comamonadaceae bacterium]MBS4036527.1 SOS response-associated peptidase family protein [Hydrogenophaga sp.]